jgi:hypothetical protein
VDWINLDKNRLYCQTRVKPVINHWIPLKSRNFLINWAVSNMDSALWTDLVVSGVRIRKKFDKSPNYLEKDQRILQMLLQKMGKFSLKLPFSCCCFSCRWKNWLCADRWPTRVDLLASRQRCWRLWPFDH